MNTRAADTKGAMAPDSTAFATGVLLMTLALSLPAFITYVEWAFMSACVENFKTAYCETIWRTAENLPRRK